MLLLCLIFGNVFAVNLRAYECDPAQDLALTPYQNYLAGKNVWLRPLFPEDHPQFRPIYIDREVLKYYAFTSPISVEEIEKMTLRKAQKNNNCIGECYHWAIITHGGVAGAVSIIHPHENEEKTEIFYCLAPAYSGRGLITEASRLVIDWVDAPMVATVHPENKASLAVLKKLGFNADPNRQNVPKYGSIRNYLTLVPH